MKVLITGGAGFIGTNLSNSLLENDFEVTVFDDFSNSSKEKSSPILKKGAKLVEGTIMNYDYLEKALAGFDLVIHLAAKIDVNESVKRPELTHEVNVTGSVNLLRACLKNKVKKIIALSSSAVFGKAETLPLSENSPLIPNSPYGASKVSMESYVKTFSNCYDINSILLRPFNVYGPGQSSAYAGVITKFMDNISKNQPLVIFGDGSQTRDFIAVEDLVEYIKKSIDSIQGKKGNTYNIATGKSISIKELANLMLTISGKKLPIKHEPSKKGEVPHSQTTVDLAQKELDFSAKINLKKGLENLLKNQ